MSSGFHISEVGFNFNEQPVNCSWNIRHIIVLYWFELIYSAFKLISHHISPKNKPNKIFYY